MFELSTLSYLTYLAVSIGMTIWVARVLSKTGEVFLVKCFGQDLDLAKSTNHLLVIGFYLVNVGFICLRLGGWNRENFDLIPVVGAKVGVSILVLGVMHFFNMMMIARFGRSVSNLVHHTNNSNSNVDDAWSKAPPPPL